MMFDPLVIVSNLLDPMTLLLMAIAVTFGIIMGAVPGLTGTLGLALMTPFTFGMEPHVALLMLGAVYGGAEYGGAIPAILINTPGTASALCTTFDGYPMAKKGQAQKALYAALIGSVAGGVFGTFCLIFLSIPLAALAMKFGAAEQFWLCIFALTIIASLSAGNVLKGLVGAILGLLLACIGMDPVTGHPRFTFNTLELLSGISVVPALIGLFAIPQAFLLLKPAGQTAVAPYIKRPGVFWQTVKESIKHYKDIMIGNIVGIVVGIMPGVGGNIATFIAYNESKRFSKHPEKFGTGVIEGVLSPETCNNTMVGGAQIPLLSLGIPGSAPAAVLLGAMMVHGLKPGFKLFTEQGNTTFTYMFGLLVTNILVLILGFLLIRVFVKVLQIPQRTLIAAILTLAIVGSYAINNSGMDVLSMGAMGLVGYVLLRFKFGVAPMALGLILGETLEEGFKLSLHLGAAKGNVLLYFFSKPASVVIIILTVLSLGYSLYCEYKKSKPKSGAAKEEPEFDEV